MEREEDGVDPSSVVVEEQQSTYLPAHDRHAGPLLAPAEGDDG